MSKKLNKKMTLLSGNLFALITAAIELHELQFVKKQQQKNP